VEDARRQQEAADAAAREQQQASVLPSRATALPAVVRNGPAARVALTGITGASSNGNQLLTSMIRDKLWRLGEALQDTPAGADFTISARVDDVAVDRNTRRIEIFWYVHNARKEEVGEIVQLNEVPAGSLERGWSTLAGSVTDEAAGAIRDVILTQQGKR